MIRIDRKVDCVGCNACSQRCPQSCIDMKEDEQGFLYPHVDVNRCIECHLCEKVCPVINQNSPRKPLATYAAKNNNPEIQKTSSSGGVFFALAQKVISEGGVVFGAKFDDRWEVTHDYAESLDGVRAFQGSKYVQSQIGDSFSKAESFLKAGRKVLFSGTPCQIAGLKRYLMKDYGDQMLAVDVVCHGVPSPLVWRDYLKYITRPLNKSDGKDTDFQSTLSVDMIRDISRISFRDKRIGWERYGFSVYTGAFRRDKNIDSQSTKIVQEERELLFEPHYENLYMQAFLKNLDLRPSCYFCPTKSGKSHSDITLADYWGVKEHQPKAKDDEGVSLLLVNSSLADSQLNTLPVSVSAADYRSALLSNPCIEKSASLPKNTAVMWCSFRQNGIEGIADTLIKMKPTINTKVLRRLKSIVRKMYRRLI